MIIFKIVFWIYFVNWIMSLINSAQPHPRKHSDTELGLDLGIVLLKLLIMVWMGIAIWMPNIFDK